MNHLTDWQLDLYLDDGLEEQERRQVEHHLATCSRCRRRLEELRPLFGELAMLALSQPDLVGQVLSRLPGQDAAGADGRRRRWPFLWLAVQGAVGVLLLVWAALWQTGAARLTDVPVAELAAVTVTPLAEAAGQARDAILQRLDTGLAALSAASQSSLVEAPTHRLVALYESLQGQVAMALAHGQAWWPAVPVRGWPGPAVGSRSVLSSPAQLALLLGVATAAWLIVSAVLVRGGGPNGNHLPQEVRR